MKQTMPYFKLVSRITYYCVSSWMCVFQATSVIRKSCQNGRIVQF